MRRQPYQPAEEIDFQRLTATFQKPKRAIRSIKTFHTWNFLPLTPDNDPI
jgi:hypothetical protein